MKKLFISQPMKGKSDEDILAERQKAIKSAEEKIGEPVEVIDSFFQEAPVDAKPLWFLGKSLELLAGADIAYFAKGWQEARGCKIENTCAIEYAELEAAIDADKKIQVVDVKAGGYVSKEKLDAKITELDGVKQQLSDANTTIQSYKDMDPEEDTYL